MPKNIVLCSDGTGNSGILGRGTNVFKLFEAVAHDWHETDPSKPQIEEQLAYYDDGVGTEKLKYLRMVAGAFGIGVRRNVRQLYKQLARVFQPGDQIYLFGFSRGAYTVRMLAWLISECGIIKSHHLADKQLDRGSAAAFKAVRSRYVRLGMRHRDQSVAGQGPATTRQKKKFLAKYPVWLPDHPGLEGLHSDSSYFQGDHPPADTVGPEAPRPNGVRIRFIGVWDTVEAYGFPMEEVADFWDRFIYPFKFPDTYLSTIVDHACHALSIDDERQTFGPTLWQAREPKTYGQTDVPPLDPRIEQVWFAGVHANVGGGYPKQGISLVALTWMMRKANEHGLHFVKHDQELYDQHQDVDDKLYDSRSGPAAYYRLLPRNIGELCAKAGITEPKLHISVLQRIQSRTDEYAPAYVPGNYTVDSVGGVGAVPVEAHAAQRVQYQEVAKDAIWWRRVIYYTLVLVSFSLALFCWWFKTEEPVPDFGSWNSLSRGVYYVVAPVLDVIDWITPNYIQPGLNALRHHPLSGVGFVLALIGISWIGTNVHEAARDLSFRAWRGSLPSVKGRVFQLPVERLWWMRIADCVRHSTISRGICNATTYVLPPVLISFAAVVVIALLCNVLVPACSIALAPAGPEATLFDDKAPRCFTFDTAHPLQPTPLILKRGEQYRIKAVPHAPWKDKDLSATPEGIDEPSCRQRLVGWWRRDSNQPWFRLLGSIGPDAAATFPIGAETVIRADRDGRLYLFVNDVFGFYHNNVGTAEITVECLTAVK